MAQIKTVDAKTLNLWLNQEDVVLIDVREVFEYNESHIPGAINIPLSVLVDSFYKIPNLKNKKIILQCAAGVRSMNGCIALDIDGFNNELWNLQDGIKSWIKCGFSVKSSSYSKLV